MIAGHVIFQGMAEKAVNFFLKSAKLQLHQQELLGVDNNAADFLFDIASGYVSNDNNEKLGTLVLAENYKKSSLYAAFRSTTRHFDQENGNKNADGEEASNSRNENDLDNGVVAIRSVTSGSSSDAAGTLKSQSSKNSGSEGGGGSGTGATKHFTSKYMATPTSEASSVVSPYKMQTPSRFQSASCSVMDSEDYTNNTLSEDDNETLLQKFCRCFIQVGDCVAQSFVILATLGREISNICHALTEIDIYMVMYKSHILWERNFKMLLNRRSLVIESTVTVIALAVIFGFVLGPSSDDYLSVLGMFGIGNLCILLTNMQYINFLFLNNQVSKFKKHNTYCGDNMSFYSKGVFKRAFSWSVHHWVELVNG